MNVKLLCTIVEYEALTFGSFYSVEPAYTVGQRTLEADDLIVLLYDFLFSGYHPILPVHILLAQQTVCKGRCGCLNRRMDGWSGESGCMDRGWLDRGWIDGW